MKKRTILFLGLLITTISTFSQIEINSDGDMDLNYNRLYITNSPTVTNGFGYNVFGGNLFTIFSDSHLDFVEPDAQVRRVRFDMNAGIFDFYGNVVLEKQHWTGGVKSGIESFSGHSMPALYPHSSWYGMLGTSSKKFGAAYINHIYYDNLTDYSDISIKENIRDIVDVKEKIKQLRPVKYDLKESYYDSIPKEKRDDFIKKGKNNVGLIAQEVQKVFPDLVVLDKSNGLLGVNYIDLIPYLLSMVQEQDEEIEKLKNAISNPLLKSATTLENKINTPITNNKLQQNFPNPWNSSTTIEMFISETVGNALLCIYDMTGKQLICYTVAERGNTQVIVHAEELKAGMYMYSLIADNRLIDTKNMILTN